MSTYPTYIEEETYTPLNLSLFVLGHGSDICLICLINDFDDEHFFKYICFWPVKMLSDYYRRKNNNKKRKHRNRYI